MNTITVSEFSEDQNLIFNRVKKTGIPVIIMDKGTRLAEIHPPSLPEKQSRKFGCMKDRLKIVGDIISPASDEKDWEVLKY
ncbi:type II toxin-antitoxin system Phd/YefM family antitoxin [Desulfonema limicola]|nr:type II toxin-antitoxin system Phd/YefM family antitoxin [Desulfonema limicola]